MDPDPTLDPDPHWPKIPDQDPQVRIFIQHCKRLIKDRCECAGRKSWCHCTRPTSPPWTGTPENSALTTRWATNFQPWNKEQMLIIPIIFFYYCFEDSDKGFFSVTDSHFIRQKHGEIIFFVEKGFFHQDFLKRFSGSKIIIQLFRENRYR